MLSKILYFLVIILISFSLIACDSDDNQADQIISNRENLIDMMNMIKTDMKENPIEKDMSAIIADMHTMGGAIGGHIADMNVDRRDMNVDSMIGGRILDMNVDSMMGGRILDMNVDSMIGGRILDMNVDHRDMNVDSMIGGYIVDMHIEIRDMNIDSMMGGAMVDMNIDRIDSMIGGHIADMAIGGVMVGENTDLNSNPLILSGQVIGSDSQSHFFKLNESSEVRLTTQNASNCYDSNYRFKLDTLLRLYRIENGQRVLPYIATHDDIDRNTNNFCSTIDTHLTAGTYEIEVSNTNNQGIDVYDLSILFYQKVPIGGICDAQKLLCENTSTCFLGICVSPNPVIHDVIAYRTKFNNHHLISFRLTASDHNLNLKKLASLKLFDQQNQMIYQYFGDINITQTSASFTQDFSIGVPISVSNHLDSVTQLQIMLVDHEQQTSNLFTTTFLPHPCIDQQDNDQDLKIDFDDDGCANAQDLSESQPNTMPACANGLDDDLDGNIDYPRDTECKAAGQIRENIQCPNLTNIPIIGNEGGSVVLDTSLSTNRNSSIICNGVESGPDLVTALILDQPSYVVASVYSDNSRFDSILYVRASDCTNGQEIACNDDIMPGSIFSKLTLERLDAGIYYFIIDGYDALDSAVLSIDFNVIPLASPKTQCNDDLDNDLDLLIDFADPGCDSFQDLEENNPTLLPTCADQVDNDGDSKIDYPLDPDCLTAGDATESLRCLSFESIDLPELQNRQAEVTIFPEGYIDEQVEASCANSVGTPSVISFTVSTLSDVYIKINGNSNTNRLLFIRSTCDQQDSEYFCSSIPNDKNQKISLLAPGRYYAFISRTNRMDREPIHVSFLFENRQTECNDQIDNDHDQLIDLFDTACLNDHGSSELNSLNLPECTDDIDNDNDGLIDYPNDQECSGAGAFSEQKLCTKETPILVSGNGGIYDFQPKLNENTSNPECSLTGSGDEAVFAIKLDQPSRILVKVKNMDQTQAIVYQSLKNNCDTYTTIQCLVSNEDYDYHFDPLESGIYYLTVERKDPTQIDPFTVYIDIQKLKSNCLDQLDNDQDGLIDRQDPGCENDEDEDETHLVDDVQSNACDDQLDNDLDGLIDYGQDPECMRASQDSEELHCDHSEIYETIIQSRSEEIFKNLTVSTFLASANRKASCGQEANSKDQVIAVVLTQKSDILVEANDVLANYDPLLHVRKDDCDDPSLELACMDDNHQYLSKMPKLSLMALDPGTYFIFVDGFSNESVGIVNLSIQIKPLITQQTQCTDQIDNDNDLLIDASDPGCEVSQDNDESNMAQLPACADQIDNDQDQQIDYPADLDCLFAGDQTEQKRCSHMETIDLIGTEIIVSPQVNASHHSYSTCGSTLGQASVIAFTISEYSDLKIQVQNANMIDQLKRMVFVRSACDELSTELICRKEVSAENNTILYGLKPGTYYVFVSRTTTIDQDPLRVSFNFISRVTECNDLLDNDNDGLIDLLDSGCIVGDSPSETDPIQPPACADHIDNDGDDLIDYPQDPNCSASGAHHEQKLCTQFDPIVVDSQGGDYEHIPTINDFNEIGCTAQPISTVAVYMIELKESSNIKINVKDRDGANLMAFKSIRTDCNDISSRLKCDRDSTIDSQFLNLEPGTYFVSIGQEMSWHLEPFVVHISVESLIKECNDSIDNDNDSLIDIADPGCFDDFDAFELDEGQALACSDGIDNDLDGFTDYPADIGCFRASHNSELIACNMSVIDHLIVQQSTNFQISTLNQVNHYSSKLCGNQAQSGEKVFVLVLKQKSDVDVSIVNANYDTVLHVRKNCDDQSTEIACNDDEFNGNTNSRIILDALDIGIYYFVVDGYGTNNTGTADIEVIVNPIQ